MNEMDISIGLVRNSTQAGTRWLAIWQESSEFFDFVIADRLDCESAREAVTREVSWRLYLDRERELLVANTAQADMEFVDILPGHVVETETFASFYNIEVYREAALDSINRNANNAWLSSQEICEGFTSDGRPLNPLIVFLINRSQVIQHWESSTGNA